MNDTILTLLVCSVALVCFLLDRPRHDLTGLLVLLALVFLKLLSPAEAFAGFSSPALLTVICLFIFSRAWQKSGGAYALGRVFSSRTSPEGLLQGLLATGAGLLAAFVSRVTVTATWLPGLMGLSRERKISSSRLLLPLSFGALLGGTVTLIGSSTNLAVQGLLESPAALEKYPGGPTPFSLFEFLPLGLILLGVAGIFFATIGRKLLPERRVEENLAEQYQMRQYLTELLVEGESDLVGHSLGDSGLGSRDQVTILGIKRGTESIITPGPETQIEAGDLLLVQGEPQNILRVQSERNLSLQEGESPSPGLLGTPGLRIMEAVVAPGSRYAGRTLGQINFRSQFGLNVLALWRHGEVYPLGLAAIPLRIGDALLLQGSERDFELLKRDGDFLLVEEVEAQQKTSGPAWATAGIFSLALVGGAVPNPFVPLDLSLALLAGCVLLVLGGVLTLKDVYESVDWSIVVLMTSMLALGSAMIKCGLDEAVAQVFRTAAMVPGSGRPDLLSQSLLLAFLFMATSTLAQLTRPLMAGVIVGPVALSLAAGMGLNPHALLMPVIVAASCCFLTPHGHQTNSMVMGPGGYRVSDYTKVGLPLLILMGLATVFLVPYFWPSPAMG